MEVCVVGYSGRRLAALHLVDLMAREDDQGGKAKLARHDVALLRAISVFRPVGEHRHFHMVSILHALDGAPEAKQANRSSASLWARLHDFYDLRGLDEMEEGSDDEEEPVWLRTYEEHSQFLRDHERARSRFLRDVDEEEFALYPMYLYEPIIVSRRVEAGDDGAQTQVVPPSQEDEGADAMADDGESESDKEERAPRSVQRRTVRKRGHTEEDTSPDLPKDESSHGSARASKRRRGSKLDDDGLDTPTRSITTRRQQKQLNDDEKKREVEDGSDAATDGAGTGSMRSTRSTPARRAASSSRSVRASPSPVPTTRSARSRRS